MEGINMEIFTDKLMEWLVLYGPKVLIALVIVIIGRIVVGMITSVIRKLLTKASVDVTLIKFLSSLIHIILLTVVIIL